MPKRAKSTSAEQAYHDLAQELDVPGGLQQVCHEYNPEMHAKHTDLEACMRDWFNGVSKAKTWAKKNDKPWPPHPECDVWKVQIWSR